MRTKQIVSGTAALALSALLFTACNNENDPTPAISSKYVTIVPTVTGEVITKGKQLLWADRRPTVSILQYGRKYSYRPVCRFPLRWRHLGFGRG